MLILRNYYFSKKNKIILFSDSNQGQCFFFFGIPEDQPNITAITSQMCKMRFSKRETVDIITKFFVRRGVGFFANFIISGNQLGVFS